MSQGDGFGGQDDIPSGEKELVRQLQEAAKNDSTEVGAKIRSIEVGEESVSTESSTKEAPYDFEKDKEFSAKFTKLRHEYAALPKHYIKSYEKQFNEILEGIEVCYGNRDYEGASKLLPAFEKQITSANNLLDDRERHSVESRKRRLAARDIPEKWLGKVNSTFSSLEKCLEDSEFERTAALFKTLDKNIHEAVQDWFQDVRSKVEKTFESAKVDAPIELIDQLDHLKLRAEQLQESGEWVDAAAAFETLLEYIDYVTEEKVRIAEEERERLLREEKNREQERQGRIKQNKRRVEELTKQYEDYASLLNGISITAASALTEIVEECKESVLNLDLESDKAVSELDDTLSDKIDETLGTDFYVVIDDIEKYKSAVEKAMKVDSLEPAQVKLRETWNAIKLKIENQSYDDAMTLFKTMGRLLGDVEGEDIYEALLLEVKPERDRLKKDSPKWLPTEIETLYSTAESLKTSAKYSQANASLRRIKPIVPKVDSVTNRFVEIKGDYDKSQNSKATTEQRKAIEKILEGAQTNCQASKFKESLQELDQLELKISDVKNTTDRRTNPDKFPKVVAKAPKGGGMTDLGVVATKLSEGGMTADEVMNLIPAGTKQSWKTNPSEPDRYKSGFKYEWTDNKGNQYHVHGHSKDNKHDESNNSGSGSVVRIRINNQWLRSDGTLTEVLFDNKAHIPLF